VDAGLDALAGLAGRDEPWVLFVGVNGPHDPYFVPAEHVNRYDLSEVPLPASYRDDMRDKPGIYQRMREQIWDQMGPEEIRDAIRHHWAYCTELDGWFGELMSALDETGEGDDTLVLYCSDHGDYCGEHGIFCKGIPCFRGAYHVPAVLRWPAGIASPGRRVEEFVSLCDFGPTFLELAGAPAQRDFTGRSLVPFLREEPVVDWRQDMMTQCNGVELYYTQRSITTKEWKYVINGFDFDELYDLRSDPHEMRNLARRPGYQDIKRQLSHRLWKFARQEQDSAPSQYITVALAEYGPAEAFRDE
jgi:arylsulfatase A-like enzyme